MKKIAIVMGSHLQNNIFASCKPYDFDNFLFQHRLLKSRLYELGYDLATYDINSIDCADIVFYYDYNDSLPHPVKSKRNILFLWESEVISPQLYQTELYTKFDIIFTFCDELIDGVKFLKMNYAYDTPLTINKDIIQKKKLCTLIAGNKVINHELELYSKRGEAIRWFETYHPREFDLYGRGWREYVTSNRLFNIISRRVPFVKQILKLIYARPFPSYRGEIADKIPVLEKYKFAICYENARDIPGYITEKIFHCFFAGCVPVYWGANNITDYIPENCFIDKHKFGTYDELYQYMSNITDLEYLNYLTNIEMYLNSEQIQQFSALHFTNTVIKEVLNEE